MKEIWKQSDASRLSNDAKREKRSVGQELNTYFCIDFSKIWREKIYNIIKKFVITKVLNCYVRRCPIIDYQT